jgi:hypothetical protein
MSEEKVTRAQDNPEFVSMLDDFVRGCQHPSLAKPGATRTNILSYVRTTETRVASLESSNAQLIKDIEQGFMPGAYARLQHLQETERKCAALESSNAELAEDNKLLEATNASLSKKLDKLRDTCGDFDAELNLPGGFKDRAERAESSNATLTKMFHDLTPGGSEFAGDPKRCFEYVREKFSTLHDIAKRATISRQAAEASNLSLVEALRKALIPLAALVLSGECTTAPSALTEEIKLAIVEAHDSVLSALASEAKEKII